MISILLHGHYVLWYHVLISDTHVIFKIENHQNVLFNINVSGEFQYFKSYGNIKRFKAVHILHSDNKKRTGTILIFQYTDPFLLWSFVKDDITSTLPPQTGTGRAGYCVDTFVTFLVAVAAGAACHYTIKWLDGNKK